MSMAPSGWCRSSERCGSSESLSAMAVRPPPGDEFTLRRSWPSCRVPSRRLPYARRGYDESFTHNVDAEFDVGPSLRALGSGSAPRRRSTYYRGRGSLIFHDSTTTMGVAVRRTCCAIGPCLSFGRSPTHVSMGGLLGSPRNVIPAAILIPYSLVLLYGGWSLMRACGGAIGRPRHGACGRGDARKLVGRLRRDGHADGAARRPRLRLLSFAMGYVGLGAGPALAVKCSSMGRKAQNIILPALISYIGRVGSPRT